MSVIHRFGGINGIRELTEKLSAAFKKAQGRAASEADVKEAMPNSCLPARGRRNYKVVKDFISIVSERATGTDVFDSLTPLKLSLRSSMKN